MIWSFVLSGIGILGIFLAGKKNKVGWAIGLGAQVLWIVFAITTAQYGFIFAALAYGSIYLKNWLSWRKDDSIQEVRDYKELDIRMNPDEKPKPNFVFDVSVVSSKRVKKVTEEYYVIDIGTDPIKDKQELTLVVNAIAGFDYKIGDVDVAQVNIFDNKEYYRLTTNSSTEGTGYNDQVYAKVTPVEDLT